MSHVSSDKLERWYRWLAWLIDVFLEDFHETFGLESGSGVTDILRQGPDQGHDHCYHTDSTTNVLSRNSLACL